LAEFDELEKENPGKKIDPFINFMFGKRQLPEHDTEESEPHPLHEQNESSFRHDHNGLDSWLFGSRQNNQSMVPPNNYGQIENMLNNIDLELVMETVDMAVTTYKQYQPILTEIPSVFKKFSHLLKLKD
jgi:hypothetical protein